MALQPRHHSGGTTNRFPQHGLIVGGLLDGWAYAFLGLEDVRDEFRVLMYLRVTPPHSPFPMEVEVVPWFDFEALRPDPKAKLVRDQPKWLDWDALLSGAVEAAWDLEIEEKKRNAQTSTDS